MSQYRPGSLPDFRGSVNEWAPQLLRQVKSEFVTISKLLADIQGQTTTIERTVVSGGGGGGSVTTHNLLSPTHPDTVSTSPARGDLLYGNSTLLWDRFPIGAVGTYLSSDGTDPSWATPAALTKVDDTNVTLTLGGTPASSLFAAVSLTLGWTGSLATTRGGTGIATYTLGDILYSDATDSLAKLAGNITATKQFLTQTGTGAVSAAPVWAALADADIPDILSITKISNLTTNGFVKTSGGDGTLSIDTNTYLTSVTAHDVLSATHGDTLAGAVVQGDIIYGNATPKWARLAIGAANRVLRSDGTDVSWSQVALGTDVSGTLPIGNGGTNTTSWTEGSVIFAGAGGTALDEDNGNIFYHNANNALLLGTTTSSGSSYPLEIEKNGTNRVAIRSISTSVSTSAGINFEHTQIAADQGNAYHLFLEKSSAGAATGEALLRLRQVGDPTTNYRDIWYVDGSTGDFVIHSGGLSGFTTRGVVLIGAAATASNAKLYHVSNNTESSCNSNYFIASFTPTADTASTYIAYALEARPSGAVNMTGTMMGYYSVVRWLSSGNGGSVIGGKFTGWYGQTTTNFGTVTSTYGIYAQGMSQFTSNPTGTITNVYGIRTQASQVAAAAMTITAACGIAIDQETIGGAGTRNTNLLVGTSTIPTGLWSIYNSSTRDNYFNGNIGIGTTSFGTSLAKGISFGSGTAPTTSPADVVQLWVADAATGAAELYSRNEAGTQRRITGNYAVTTANFSMTSNNTLTNVTGLSLNVEAGRTYSFLVFLRVSHGDGSGGGFKVGIGGTATATYYIAMAQSIDVAGVAATGTGAVIGNNVMTVAAAASSSPNMVLVAGTIVVNAGGTITVMFAQNTSSVISSNVIRGSYFQFIN